jgi:hypothetical protein
VTTHQTVIVLLRVVNKEFLIVPLIATIATLTLCSLEGISANALTSLDQL